MRKRGEKRERERNNNRERERRRLFVTSMVTFKYIAACFP
jgi:hypothetical protein